MYIYAFIYISMFTTFPVGDHRVRRTGRRPMTAGNVRCQNTGEELSPRDTTTPSLHLRHNGDSCLDQDDFSSKMQLVEQRHIDGLLCNCFIFRLEIVFREYVFY